MCYEFDAYFTRALLDEQLRLKKARIEALQRQGRTATPATPAVPEKRTVPQDPVPA
jgi:hypothetical protein